MGNVLELSGVYQGKPTSDVKAKNKIKHKRATEALPLVGKKENLSPLETKVKDALFNETLTKGKKYHCLDICKIFPEDCYDYNHKKDSKIKTINGFKKHFAGLLPEGDLKKYNGWSIPPESAGMMKYGTNFDNWPIEEIEARFGKIKIPAENVDRLRK